MKRNWKRNALIVCCLSALALNQTACSVIDEDTDDCRAEYDATYELHLITNEEHEINRVLGDGSEVAMPLRNEIADALREHLKDVFGYKGRDLDLSFYDLNGFLARTHQEEHNMEGQPVKHVYLSLPVGEYRHVAAANIKDNGEASFYRYDQNWHEAALKLSLDGPAPLFDGSFTPSFGFPWQEGIDRDLPSDYIPATSVGSMHTGMFTGRRDLISPSYGSYKEYNELKVRNEYTFTQPLYIANSAAAIILDPRSAKFSDVQVFTTGFATRFTPADSVYHFDELPLVKAETVKLNNTPWMCFCTVNFPSREANRQQSMAPTRAVDNSDNPPYRIDTDEPFLYEDCGKNIWRYEVYVKLKDAKESITRTVLNIRHPLRAGQLKIIKAYIDDQGVIRLYDTELGVAVDLQWQTGWIFNPVIG